MKRWAARFLIFAFVADLFGVATLQAASDVHDGPAGYSQEGSLGSETDLPDCSHACHASLHFVALPPVAMRFAPVDSELQVGADTAAILPAPAVKTYHPPRARSRA